MSVKIKILLVDYTRSFGGAFEQVLRLIKELSSIDNITLGLVSLQKKDSIKDRIPTNVELFTIHPPLQLPKSDLGLGRLGKLSREIADYPVTELPLTKSLFKVSKKFGAQVIHLNNLLNIQLSGVLTAKLLGAKCVSVHQDFEYPSRITKICAKYVDAHVAISDVIREDLVDQLLIPRSKIHLIYNCVDLASFPGNLPQKDISHEFAIPPERKVFALFARLVPWKGAEVFLQATRLVLKRHPNVHALVVGDTSDGDPDYAEKLLDLSKELGISEHVTFTGYRNDVASLMLAVDVVTHLSTRAEPFGLVLVEAMACSKPIVAVNIGGPLEIVQDNITGLIVPTNNPEATAHAIAQLLSNDEQRYQFGIAGRKRVELMFSSTACAEKYSRLYHSLLNG